MLRSTDTPALVLSDGSLPALVALAIAAAAHRPEQGGPKSSVLPASPVGALLEVQRAAALHQAALYGLSPIQGVPPRGGQGSGAAGEHESRLLLDAAYAAARLGCRTLVTPAMACAPGKSPDVPGITRLVDRCLLVGRIVSLDTPALGLPEVRVEPLFADLDDDALADLAVDMDCPVDTCWWFADRSAAADLERERWLPALERQGGLPAGGPRVVTRPVGRTLPA